MTHYFLCPLCGRKWTEEDLAFLPQSNTTDIRPVCCGETVTQEIWEEAELSELIEKAVQEAAKNCPELTEILKRRGR